MYQQKSNKRHPGTYLFHKSEDGCTVQVYVPEHASLQEQLEAFGGFLRAVSYRFDGEIEVVKDEV